MLDFSASSRSFLPSSLCWGLLVDTPTQDAEAGPVSSRRFLRRDRNGFEFPRRLCGGFALFGSQRCDSGQSGLTSQKFPK